MSARRWRTGSAALIEQYASAVMSAESEARLRRALLEHRTYVVRHPSDPSPLRARRSRVEALDPDAPKWLRTLAPGMGSCGDAMCPAHYRRGRANLVRERES